MSALVTMTAVLVRDLGNVRPDSHNPVFVTHLIRRAITHLEATMEALESLESSEATLVARVQELERKPRR